MASTTSSLLKLELQTTGENSSTWGTKLNNVISETEKAITGEVTVSMAGSADVTLTDIDFNTSQSRYAALRFTGAITGSVKAIVPARVKWFYAINATTQTTAFEFTMSVGTASGTAVAIPPSAAPTLVYCDGTNCVLPQPALPTAHLATSTDHSLNASPSGPTLLTFASGDIVSDSEGMFDAANNRLVLPATASVALVQLNAFSSITDDTTALAMSIWSDGFGQSPGSSTIMGYWENSTIAARSSSSLKSACVTALIYNGLVPSYATRNYNIHFGGKAGSGTHTLYGFTIDAVILK